MFSSFAEDSGREERPFDRTAHLPAKAWPEPARLSMVLDKLAAAKRPVLIGGHGVWWSGAESYLEEAGRKLGIPVFNIPYHQKLLGEECEAYMGLADIHQYHPSKDAFAEADLVLMVGARLDNQMNFGNPPLFPHHHHQHQHQHQHQHPHPQPHHHHHHQQHQHQHDHP